MIDIVQETKNGRHSPFASHRVLTEQVGPIAYYRGRGYPGGSTSSFAGSGTGYSDFFGGTRKGRGGGRSFWHLPVPEPAPAPSPKKPFFFPERPKPAPFGKKYPKPFSPPLNPTPRTPALPKLLRFLRIHPGVHFALLALDAYLLWRQWQNAQVGGYQFTSEWTRVCYNPWSPNPGSPEPGAGMNFTGGASVCNSNFAPFNADYGTAIPLTWNGQPVYGVSFGPHANLIGTRVDFQESWTRPYSPNIRPVPQYRPPRPARFIPADWLSPDPQPLPWPAIPYVPSHPGREVGPPSPTAPGAQPEPTPPLNPPTRNPSRPGRGIRERKQKWNVWKQAVWAIWSAASEVPDWVGAFWDAMPESFRKWEEWKSLRNTGRNLSLDEKALLIAQHIDMINGEEAIKNILYNLAEDAIAGRIIRILDGVGIGVGFNGTPHLKGLGR